MERLSQLIVLLIMIVSTTKVFGHKLYDNERHESHKEANGAFLSRLRREVPGFVGKYNEKKSHVENFSQSLFENEFSVKVRKAVLETQFFKKIIDNTLAPEEYGGYMVEDAAYVYDSIKAFDIAAERMTGEYPPDFQLFYRGRSASYTSYGSYFNTEWRIQNAANINMGPAAASYVAFVMKTAQTNPKYLSISILPCDMLWPWVAKQIDSEVPKTNVYRSWVDNNLGDGSSSTQTFVNKFFSPSDKETAELIFNEGIINELNFFRSACGEKPVDYSFGYQE